MWALFLFSSIFVCCITSLELGSWLWLVVSNHFPIPIFFLFPTDPYIWFCLSKDQLVHGLSFCCVMGKVSRFSTKRAKQREWKIQIPITLMVILLPWFGENASKQRDLIKTTEGDSIFLCFDLGVPNFTLNALKCKLVNFAILRTSLVDWLYLFCVMEKHI